MPTAITTLGFSGSGNIPVRSKGRGGVPVPGGDSQYQWLGYIPKEQMPQRYNPESGFLVNANNRNVDSQYRYFVSADFEPDYRARRIEQLLQEFINKGHEITVVDMEKMQADVKDISALKLLSRMRKLEVFSEQEREAIRILRQWDAQADVDSVGATIYYSWLRHLLQVLFSDELQADWGQFDQGRYMRKIYQKVTSDTLAELIQQGSPWCDDIKTNEVEDCNFVLKKSLADMLKQMNKLAGDDMSEWQWGVLQNAEYKHMPFSTVRILDKFFGRTISNGGASNTINVSVSDFDETQGYRQSFGAGFRQIVQMSETHPIHMFNNSTGQSGHIISTHFDDSIESFRDVRFLPSWKKDGNVSQLILMPSREKGIK